MKPAKIKSCLKKSRQIIFECSERASKPWQQQKQNHSLVGSNAMKIKLLVYACWISLILSACHHQPKAESKDYTKVKVSDSGHRDSVVDNKARLYNASIPDPCLKCIVAAVRQTARVQPYVSAADSSKIIYQVDWSSGPKLDDTLKKAGSGLLIHVFKKGNPGTLLAAFNFDNVKGRLYLINNQKQHQVVLDSTTRLKIRNSCFWGVASGK